MVVGRAVSLMRGRDLYMLIVASDVAVLFCASRAVAVRVCGPLE